MQKKKKEEKPRMRNKCNCDQLRYVECILETKDLWDKFHDYETEMIITKTGRRMFPTVRCSFLNLRPDQRYWVLLDIVPCDNKRYRYAYHRSSWLVAGKADPPPPHRLYPHPDAPYTGEQLRKQVVSFEKVKLTNNEMDKNGQMVLNSMHRFQPRVHLVTRRNPHDNSPIVDLERENYHTYVFPETVFTAVTAYQNQLITKLKIDSNPFAKGFRDSSRLNDYESDYSPYGPMPPGMMPPLGLMGFPPPHAPPGHHHLHHHPGGMLDPSTAALLFRTNPLFAVAAQNSAAAAAAAAAANAPVTSEAEQNNNFMAVAAEKARAAVSMMLAQHQQNMANSEAAATGSSPGGKPVNPAVSSAAVAAAAAHQAAAETQQLHALLAAHHQQSTAALYGRVPAGLWPGLPATSAAAAAAVAGAGGLLSSAMTSPPPSSVVSVASPVSSPTSSVSAAPRPVFPPLGMQRFTPYVIPNKSPAAAAVLSRSTPSPAASSSNSPGSEKRASPPTTNRQAFSPVSASPPRT